MATVPFHYVDLRAFAYATENVDRVEAALRTFLPAAFPVERTRSEGYHGDRILVLETRVENADDVRHVLGRLAAMDSVGRVLDELDERVTENTELFLRLDKQAAYRGRVELGAGLTLRGKVEAYPADRDRAIENARDVLTRLAEADGVA